MPNDSSNNSSIVMEQRLDFRVTYQYGVPLILLLCVIALVVNGVVLLAYLHLERSRLHATLRLNLSLVVCDMWTTVLVAVSLVLNSYLPYVFGFYMETACYVLAMEVLKMGSILTCVCHLVVLSINHYLSIAHPFTYRTLLSPRNILIVLLFIWLTPPISLLLVVSVQPGQGFLSHKCLQLELVRTGLYRYVISTSILLMVVIMIALYTAVLCILRRLRAKFTDNNKSKSNQVRDQQMKRERRMLTTSFYVCGTFFLGWIPGCLQFALTCNSCTLDTRTRDEHAHIKKIILFVLSLMATAFIILKAILNPIIYATRIPEIKDQLQKFKRKYCGGASPYGDNQTTFASHYRHNSERSCRYGDESGIKHTQTVDLKRMDESSPFLRP